MATSDWMPTSREAKVKMAKDWNVYIASKPKTIQIPSEVLETLTTRTENLAVLLETPLSTRTPALNADIRAKERELIEIMRYVKTRYFFIPPLTESDMLSLGLKPKDSIPTPIGPPVMTAEGDMSFPAIGLVEVRNIRPGGKDADKRSNYGVRIHYGILSNDDGANYRITQPPKTGDNLPYSVFTRKKSHSFDFAVERGKQLFVCMRYENSKGEKGPWGKILEAFIP